MRVICLLTGNPDKTFDCMGNKGVYVPPVYVGNEYTVVDKDIHNGRLFYELAEVPPDGFIHFQYESKMFGIPSDIDETELVKDREICV